MADYPKQFFEGQGNNSAGFVTPYKLGTGSMRGTQTVGFGDTKIDGANNRIIITNPTDGTKVGIGTVPGSTTGEFGFFTLDDDDNVIIKIVGPTMYVFDLLTSKNIIQIGKLPDSTYGMVVAKPDVDVADVFSQ